MSKDSNFTGHPVYSQVLKLLDREKIMQISRETVGSEAYVKRFDGYQHLVVMLFGILGHYHLHTSTAMLNRLACVTCFAGSMILFLFIYYNYLGIVV